MRGRGAKKVLSSDSEDEQPLSKLKKYSNDDSSSESDIENYLKPADKLDLDSEFFNNVQKEPSFANIEKDIFSGVTRLSDSESEKEIESQPSTSKYNFTHLHEYSKKIEETKRHLHEYQAKKKKEETDVNVETLLAIGEKIIENDAKFNDSDSEQDGWEEVKEMKENSEKKPENIEVNVNLPSSARNKKEIDLMSVIKRRINRVKKENQVFVHKVHLLCWLAHGRHVSSIINTQNVLGTALSLLPSEKCYPPDRTDLNYLEQILKWFRNCIELSEKDKYNGENLEQSLQNQISKKIAYNKKMLVFIFIAVLRALGIQCRLVISLQVEPVRPWNSELLSLSTKKENDTKNKTKKVEKKEVCQVKTASKPKKVEPQSETNKTKSKKVESKKSKGSEAHKSDRRTRSSKIPQLDGSNDTVKAKKPNLRKLKNDKASTIKTLPKGKIVKYRDTDSEDEFEKPKLKTLKDYIPKAKVRNDIVDIIKSSIKEKKDLMRAKRGKKNNKKVEESDDSDYVPEEVKKRQRDSDDEFSNKIKVKKRVQVRPEPEQDKKKKVGNDFWAEVFLESEEKWISVDVVKGQVHCVKELVNRASHPMSYVLAWNNDNTIKDITKRYCVNFNTATRKLRVDSKWWDTTLKPFQPTKTAREKEEDDEFERQQLEKPLPASISEYKNHPLYVLKRHLLKFEALYPPDAPSLGFIKNEPVYSRQCVYVLHSRDIWLKQAKVVKPGEQPYKIVKARPKWDKSSNSMITDQLLEIFGPWQTQDYQPPTAENGKVPRNAFGNVELFKDCMLPKGTVHLKLPGLNKIARRMNIDCAAALVGFDFHGGWNHPTYDGFIVCQEFEDELILAWELEQEEIQKKEQEKIFKRVYGNWKKLIRGLLIRERLKAKYEFGEPSNKKKKK